MSHVLFISHARGIHGAEAVMVQAIKACIAKGMLVTVVVPSIVPDEGLEDTLNNLHVDILAVPYRAAGKHALRTLLVRIYNTYALSQLKQLVTKEKINIIYSNTSITILGAILAKQTGVRHVWHFHEPVSPLYGWHYSLRYLYNRLVQHTDTIICVSKKQRDQWQNELHVPFQCTVVYNPVRELVLHDKKEPHEHLRIGFIGQYSERKNIPMLISVFSRFQRTNPHSELWICGAKNKQEQARWKQTYSQEHIRFILQTNDVSAFYEQIDILALPSTSESWGLVCIEAMQAGVCVLLTSVSALSEIYKNEEECLFISPNDEDAWLAALVRCSHSEIRFRMAQNGQKRTKEMHYNQQFDHQIQTLLCE